ncbi:MAG: NHL repeat-containing protein [Candidatus Krumholzibacteria bacterium]|nr:NHL repeat-containing protein [Candidatus Krumholzibacteria bacterium]
MKRIVPALVIPLILCSPVPRVAGSMPARVESPDPSMHAGDSTAFPTNPDTSLALRIEETGLRFGAGDLREPTGIAVDQRGAVYVADAMAGKVFRYTPDSVSLEFERPPNNAAFYPIDVAVQQSFVLVLDYSQNKLLRYDSRGAYLDVLLSFDVFDRVRPVSLTGGPGGRIITADVANHAVVLWTPLLDRELTIGEFGWSPGRFNAPRKAAFLPNQGLVVVESGNRRLQFFSPSGRYERIVQPSSEKPFVSPRSVEVDNAGTIFVCDSEQGRVSVFTAEGARVTDIDSFSGEAISPAAAAAGWDGALYVADLKSRSVLVYRLFYPRER